MTRASLPPCHATRGSTARGAGDRVRPGMFSWFPQAKNANSVRAFVNAFSHWGLRMGLQGVPPWLAPRRLPVSQALDRNGVSSKTGAPVVSGAPEHDGGAALRTFNQALRAIERGQVARHGTTPDAHLSLHFALNGLRPTNKLPFSPFSESLEERRAA